MVSNHVLKLTNGLILPTSLAFLLFALPQSGAGAYAAELQPSLGAAAQLDVPDSIRARSSEAELALQKGDHRRALALQREVIDWLEKNPKTSQSFRATSFAALASMQVMADQPEAALASLRSAVSIFRTLPSRTSDLQAQLASALQLQGLIEAQQGELNAALSLTAESVSLLRTLLPGDPAVRSSLVNSLMNLGAIHYSMANAAEAIRSSEEALPILRELARQDPELRDKLASLLRNLSVMVQATGRLGTALAYGQESVAILQLSVETNPDMKSSLLRSQKQVESVTREMPAVGVPTPVPPLVTAFLSQLRSGAIQAAVDALMKPTVNANQDKARSLPADEAKKALAGMDVLRELVLSSLQSDVNQHGSLRSLEVIRSVRQPDGLLRIHVKITYARAVVYTTLVLESSEAGTLLREYKTSDHDLNEK